MYEKKITVFFKIAKMGGKNLNCASRVEWKIMVRLYNVILNDNGKDLITAKCNNLQKLCWQKEAQKPTSGDWDR